MLASKIIWAACVILMLPGEVRAADSISIDAPQVEITPATTTPAPWAPSPKSETPAPKPIAPEIKKDAALNPLLEKSRPVNSEAAAAKARREERAWLESVLTDADRLAKTGQWESAGRRYRYVWEFLQGPAPAEQAAAVDKLRARAATGLAEASARRGQQKVAAGNFADGILLLRQAVELEPKRVERRQALAAAQRKFARWQESAERGTVARPNSANTREAKDRDARVDVLIAEGDAFFEALDLDKAEARWKHGLALDPQRTEPLDRLTKLEKERAKAVQAARASARAQGLAAVDAAWTSPVVRGGQEGSSTGLEVRRAPSAHAAALLRKLYQLRVPEIRFEALDVREAVAFLSAKSRELDPRGEGVNLVLKANTSMEATPSEANEKVSGSKKKQAGKKEAAALALHPQPVVTLQLEDVPLMDAVRALALAGNLEYRLEEHAVVLQPLGGVPSDVATRTFAVPAGFFSNAQTVQEAGATLETRVGYAAVDGQRELEELGVPFPAGTSAAFLPSVGRLVVRHRPEQLEAIAAILRDHPREAPQVEIETRFAEFTEEALRELSFQYIVNVDSSIPTISAPTANPPGGIGSGVLSPIASAQYSAATALRNGRTSAEDPFGGVSVGSLDNLLSRNTPSGAGPVNLLTGRALLPNTPNTFAIGAVIGGRGLAAFLNALDNTKGVDLLSAPKVTTRSRVPAKIEVVRQLRYPTSFERPVLANQPFAVNNGDLEVNLALPPTPLEFVSRNVGVTLRVVPVVYADGRIDLELEPEVTDFEGFVNYGQPVRQRNFFDTPDPAQEGDILTRSRVDQPVFNVRSISTKLQVVDGQSVVMGGLIREETQKVNDKVPVLGDIPLIGRLFQSKVDQTIKRNLMIIVTARLVPAVGQADEAPRPVRNGEGALSLSER